MLRYYVYELFDPTDQVVFYVGKGTGGRIDQHVAYAKRGARGRKCDKIRSILERGVSVGKRIVDRFDDENEALDCEERLIDQHGLQNLTNVLPGGKLGVEAYLRRKALREASGDNYIKSVFEREIAPRLAYVLKLREEGRSLGFTLPSGWVDFTEVMLAFSESVKKIVGADTFDRTIGAYTVKVASGAQ